MISYLHKKNDMSHILNDKEKEILNKISDKAKEFQKKHQPWFDEVSSNDSTKKSVHDYYSVAWNDMGVRFGVTESNMPDEMKEELFNKLNEINFVDDSDLETGDATFYE